MGANAQTTVPTFTAGEVLTAAQMNNSARTGVPVFATTITRDAGFGGTGEKTLAEGQMCYVEGTGLQTYNGTSWVTWGAAPSTGALVYLTQGTFTTVASVSMAAGTFTSTYDHYKVFVRLTASSTTNAFGIRVNNAGSARTGASYYYGGNNVTNGASSSSIAGSGATSVVAGYTNTAIFGHWSIDVHDPLNTSTYTGVTVNYIGSDSGGNSGGGYTGGFYYVTEANDGLTFVVANTMSGTYWVYGYKDS
jgi:hypothetical protein